LRLDPRPARRDARHRFGERSMTAGGQA